MVSMSIILTQSSLFRWKAIAGFFFLLFITTFWLLQRKTNELIKLKKMKGGKNGIF